MKILVTGFAGYIAAHFINRIDREKHQIVGVDNFCQGRNNIIPGIEYREVDIRNKEALIQVFRDELPDVVVHYAAIANVPDSVAHPDKYYDVNIVGSLNILEVMREVGCDKIIFSSSAAVYGQSTELITEDHPKNPTNPYGYTKLVFEQILADYHRAYGINSISFRYFCATGCDESGKVGCYHDPETQVIPNIVKTLLGKQEVFNIWGSDFDTPDGTGVRDYIHVNDLADAHILALERLDSFDKRHRKLGDNYFPGICEVYNLGINKGFSVMELIKEAERVTGIKLNYKFSPRRPGDPPSLIASSQKAQRFLGWRPRYTDIGEIIMTDFNFFKTR